MGSARNFHERGVLALTGPACWSWPVVSPDAVDLPEDYVGLEIGLGMRELLAFKQFHAGRCALCGQAPSKLVRDHCHASNLLRGLLCTSCNRLEGSRDGVFDDYRQRNPATILDYWEPYNDWPVRPELFGSPPLTRMLRAAEAGEPDDRTGEVVRGAQL